jgi:hypothetical protein
MFVVQLFYYPVLRNSSYCESSGDQLQRDVQRWLSPPDPSTNHNFVWKGHKSGTAEWFFESNVLTEWKAKGSLLWIYGKRMFLHPQHATLSCIDVLIL